MCLWANCSASTTAASGTSRAPPSTITIEESVPATTMSRADCSSSWNVGFSTGFPSIRPTRTPETGSGNGMSDTMSAAEAPVIPRMSESFA